MEPIFLYGALNFAIIGAMNLSPLLNILLLILASVMLMAILYRYLVDSRISALVRTDSAFGTVFDSLFLPRARDRFGHTALHYAAEAGDLETCRMLIARGADVNAQGGGGWGTPLHWAMRSASYEMCVLLIENGADVNATCGGTAGGATPLDELDRCLEYGRNPDWHTWRQGRGVEEELIPVYRRIADHLTSLGGKRNL